jgi:hypothetical protein
MMKGVEEKGINDECCANENGTGVNVLGIFS